MSHFIEVWHEEWVAASVEAVRAHYCDLRRCIQARGHARERLRWLSPGPDGPRYERVRHGLLRTERDLLERYYRCDGTIVDFCVAGTNWGRTICINLQREANAGRNGTLIAFTVTQPLPLSSGWLFECWVRKQIYRDLYAMLDEDRVLFEQLTMRPSELRIA